MTKKKELNEEGLNQIIERFKNNEIEISNAYGDGGHQDPWARFHRAAINQIGGDEPTVSRYAIWSNTVRDNLIKALEEIDDDDFRSAKERIIKSVNSLSAFSEVQYHFDENKD